MSKITGNEPAMPKAKQILGSGEDYHEIPGSDGLTIRQHFAAMAMQGFASIYLSNNNTSIDKLDNPNGMAKLSVLFADSLIEELNKETK